MGRTLVGSLVVVLLLAVPAAAAAQNPTPIEVGVLSVAANNAGPEAVEDLRTALENAASALANSSGRSRALMVINGSVVRLEQETLGDRVRFHAEVSLILVDARRGGIRAMLSGTATVTAGAPRSENDVRYRERAVIQAAAQSAFQQVGTVLTRVAAAELTNDAPLDLLLDAPAAIWQESFSA